MCTELMERLDSTTDFELDKGQHECASCRHKERVYVTSPDGRRMAGVWRCRTLSQKTRSEVLVQPRENCYEHRSLTDYWEPTQRQLVR